MIEIVDLRKRFGATLAVDGITTSIGAGEFAVLLGQNGAGKTTLLRCLLGLLAYEGTVRVGGVDVARDGRTARRLIGYVPQRPAFPTELTCAETLDLFARLRGQPAGDASWLARVGLEAQARTPVRALSGGMRQRLALAVALQAAPRVILFDEPAAHLDVAARRALHRDLQTLVAEGRTVVLSTHLAAESLQPATRALVMDRGRLVYDGPPQELGSAVQQRIVFTLNGSGRDDLLTMLAAMADVTASAAGATVVALAPAGRAFDVLAAVAAAGIRPVAVHVEEPAVDSALVAAGRRPGAARPAREGRA
ncbi:MAG: ABC transporter ATP-binding protein [Armatimonadota bacterium]|nr:ABC transporter ATP-binding protein [Armatimonadota bacterium]MDR7486297.1 ABC transporter ATP-binding protein [Armatimonadota bacterium]MDR7532272.1 ABC transporter ATP-binding protein [Armatimonadota bacterium]MDR7537255.1 ABC transporter ATP-binding protein [Armatimonadota bacterium]